MTALSSYASTMRTRTDLLSHLYSKPLQRIQVLGVDPNGHSGSAQHTGCVNALSWAQNGELLLSGGDDTTVRIWRLDSTLSEDARPLSCVGLINTGHRANIFNAHMLPHSTRIATVAGDRQVRIFDIGDPPSGKDGEVEYNDARSHLLLCHKDRVKRLVTEESPDIFLTVSEDSSVRQHDLRRPHRCRGECPAPLVQMDHDLTSLSLSPLSPHQFVVAGGSPYGYLFDRRYLRARRFSTSFPNKELTTCTLLFSKPSRGRDDSITGVRMNASSSDEVIMAYSGDGVYRFSTLDTPAKDSFEPAISPSTSSEDVKSNPMDVDFYDPDEVPSNSYSNSNLNVGVVTSVQKYTGARNIETVKEVNFLGPRDEYVVAGSDDGNFFVWNKDDASIHGVYEGDGSVVNVIEGHPYLPLVATSGIDYTVKLFSPSFSDEPSLCDKTLHAEEIVAENTQARARLTHFQHLRLMRLFAAAHVANRDDADLDSDDEEVAMQCPNQ
ncbi:WD40 repeat-like protein [Cylindrobasidium torrendii FP15055 ss-10]|uniref:WD40 repeat-like protein n=1 Tax=Cylindrobasidium torrendii FP15055 ss-10 TaxID=1314674 RepID=A0A0D7BLY6_9AGAR|nr:WD40 repeat-like protein [Cylindrobasidium torrendii FP15055 ss-10]